MLNYIKKAGELITAGIGLYTLWSCGVEYGKNLKTLEIKNIESRTNQSEEPNTENDLGGCMCEKTRLYFCDGKACDEAKKIVCFTNGGDCIRTHDKDHSIKKKLGDEFPKTKWVEFGDDIYLEEVDNHGLMEQFMQ